MILTGFLLETRMTQLTHCSLLPHVHLLQKTRHFLQTFHIHDRGSGPAPLSYNRPVTEHSVKKRPEGLKEVGQWQKRSDTPSVLHTRLSNFQTSYCEITVKQQSLIFMRTCKPNHKDEMRSLYQKISTFLWLVGHTYKINISLYCGNHISICEQTTWKKVL